MQNSGTEPPKTDGPIPPGGIAGLTILGVVIAILIGSMIFYLGRKVRKNLPVHLEEL
jgi:hypothetical protein